MILLFPSFSGLIDILLARFLSGATVVYFFHEPYDSFLAYLRSGFGIVHTLRISVVSLVSYLIVLFSDHVVLPSNNAVIGYQKSYGFMRKKGFRLPLLFDDERLPDSQLSPRNRISYVGTVAPDHAFDKFLDFVLHATRNNWFPEFGFLIATKSRLSDAQMALIEIVPGRARIEIIQGSPLSNAEINHCFSRSVVVWNAYSRSMQSGVLPKAFMFGTPVLVASANTSEFFVDGRNGAIIDHALGVVDVKRGIEKILAKFDAMSNFCRADFMQTFFYRAWVDLFNKNVFRSEG